MPANRKRRKTKELKIPEVETKLKAKDVIVYRASRSSTQEQTENEAWQRSCWLAVIKERKETNVYDVECYDFTKEEDGLFFYVLYESPSTCKMSSDRILAKLVPITKSNKKICEFHITKETKERIKTLINKSYIILPSQIQSENTPEAECALMTQHNSESSNGLENSHVRTTYNINHHTPYWWFSSQKITYNSETEKTKPSSLCVEATPSTQSPRHSQSSCETEKTKPSSLSLEANTQRTQSTQNNNSVIDRKVVSKKRKCKRTVAEYPFDLDARANNIRRYRLNHPNSDMWWLRTHQTPSQTQSPPSPVVGRQTTPPTQSTRDSQPPPRPHSPSSESSQSSSTTPPTQSTRDSQSSSPSSSPRSSVSCETPPTQSQIHSQSSSSSSSPRSSVSWFFPTSLGRQTSPTQSPPISRDEHKDNVKSQPHSEKIQSQSSSEVDDLDFSPPSSPVIWVSQPHWGRDEHKDNLKSQPHSEKRLPPVEVQWIKRKRTSGRWE